MTAIVDMPLNCVPATTMVDALEAKRSAARGKVHVDVAFWGGVVPGNSAELEPLVDAGVRGFKCFLVPSGVDEFPHVDESDLRLALPILARRGVPLLVHAESLAFIGGGPFDFRPQVVDGRAQRGHTGPPRRPDVEAASYANYLATRPPAAEVDAVRLMVRLAREFNARVHIVHVACAEAADEIAQAKGQGVPITAETCPHYLTFAAEDIRDGATEFKCAPPIREAHHREALWDALQRGVLDLVATDHSPAPPAMKCPGDFMRAWGGIASLELSLPATWTGLLAHVRADACVGPEADTPVRPDETGYATLARWMSVEPAMLAGLSDRKGRIAAGYDADLVVWDPDAEFAVDATRLHQRHALTPYAGRTLRGVVRTTYLRGERVWDGERVTTDGAGRLL